MSKRASPSKKSDSGGGVGDKVKKPTVNRKSTNFNVKTNDYSNDTSEISIDFDDGVGSLPSTISTNSQTSISQASQFPCKHVPSTFDFIKMYHLVARNLQWNKQIKQACDECGGRHGILLACLQCPTFGCWNLTIQEETVKSQQNHFSLHSQLAGHALGVEVSSGVVYCAVCNGWIWTGLMEDAWNRAKASPTESPLIPFLESVHKVHQETGGARQGIIKAQCRMIRGLYNLGNTCFMNSILQTLLFTPPFLSFFLTSDPPLHSKNQCNRGDHCIACEVDALICRLHDGESAPVAPNRLLEALWRHSRDLAGYEQQDAHELFVTLRTAIHSDLGGSMYNCHCVIHCIFSGILQSDLICPSCEHKAETLDPFLDISLDIPPSQTVISLSSCLERFTRAEVLQVSNFVCSACNTSHVDLKKKLSIRMAPQVLVIHLKRFEHGAANVGTKVDTPINFGESLDLKPFMASASDPSLPTQYRLFAVVNHVGSLDSGHYTTFVRNRGSWFWVDDACVHACQLEAVLSRNAYMLFYSRLPNPSP